MDFDDSDWTSDAAAAAATRRDGRLAWVLALGVLIGAAGAALVFVLLQRWPGHEARERIVVAPAVAAPANPPAALVESAPPGAGSAPAAVETAPADSAPPAAAPAPAASVAAPRPSNEELRRKERAWAAYYRRPAACDGNPTTDQLIECANHFIRSKREFDERWKAGTL